MKDSNILDDFPIDNKGVNTLEDIKRRLRNADITNFYEHQNRSVIVKESEAVKISVRLENEQIKTKRSFPTIGNPVQIIITILLAFIFIIITRIIIGQLVSYFWYSPKIKQLEENVINLLQ
jgi:hypothetical protein